MRRYDYEIPRSVVDIVKAICSDYNRRSKLIGNGNVNGKVLARYIYINQVVDTALNDVEIGIRKMMIEDIYYKRGYNNSPAATVISERAYYNRKRKLIYDIAVSLRLL